MRYHNRLSYSRLTPWERFRFRLDRWLETLVEFLKLGFAVSIFMLLAALVLFCVSGAIVIWLVGLAVGALLMFITAIFQVLRS